MKTRIKTTLIIVSALWLLPSVSLAAEMFFRAEEDAVPTEGSFLVEVMIDTEGTPINAVEGRVLYPEDILSLKEVREGNSILNFWVDRPKASAPGEIHFSGMTPGGFSGGGRYLFGLIFKVKKEGAGSMDFGEVTALLNDGAGTRADVRGSNFEFTVSDSAAGRSDMNVSDSDPPESFVPLLASDPAIFEGRFFIAFSTVDKGAGIDRYEVREGSWGKYQTVESPYELRDQSLRKNIYVKAVDKAGNERVVKVKAPKGGFGLAGSSILVIIILVFIFILRKKIWPRRSA